MIVFVVFLGRTLAVHPQKLNPVYVKTTTRNKIPGRPKIQMG